LIVLAPDFMTKICKKAAQHFHCAVSKVFDMVHKYQKTGQDHKGNGSAATSTVDDKEMLIFVELHSSILTYLLIFISSSLS
jgi:transposase